MFRAGEPEMIKLNQRRIMHCNEIVDFACGAIRDAR